MILAVLGVVLLFLGVIFLICTLVESAKVRSFLGCSESIMGSVGGKYVHHGKHQRFYSMDILYTVDGKEYKRSVPASLSEHETLEEGDPFEIRYKPSNPKKIIRADSTNKKSEKSLRILTIVSASMTVVGIIMLLIAIISRM